MRHVCRTQHANQNKDVGTHCRRGAQASKRGLIIRGHICKVLSRGNGRNGRNALAALDRRRSHLVGSTQIPNAHGNRRVKHARNSQQGEGGQGRQVFQQTEREEGGSRDAHQGEGARGLDAGGHEQCANGVCQNHGIGEDGEASFEGARGGGNPGGGFANGVGPCSAVGFAVGVGADSSDEGEAVAGEEADDGDEGDGGEDCGGGIAKGGDSCGNLYIYYIILCIMYCIHLRKKEWGL